MRRFGFIIIFFVIALVLSNQNISAQTTEFTYQGSLNNGGTPANGNFDFEFALFDALSGGTQLGTTITVSNTAVSNGSFSVKIDFGNQFTGANRFLEIRVRQAGQPGITVLSPRQLVNSNPYSVKSLNAENAINATTATNALNLGGVAANQFVLTGDARLSDARNPLPNSPNYIRNSQAPQASPSNFWITGTGIADIFRATTQFNIGPSRIIGISGSTSLYVGYWAGEDNTTGSFNSFFGMGAGSDNSEGTGNSFFGYNAGRLTTTGGSNSFFGSGAGNTNLTGFSNSFFGSSAGTDNTTGDANSFFGSASGAKNTTGSDNSFFGTRAGVGNRTGSLNSIFGNNAGWANQTGNENAFFGNQAGENATVGFNSFFGSQAGRDTTTGVSNAFFGRRAGIANTTGSFNTFFGASAGFANETGGLNAFFGTDAGVANTTGNDNSFFGVSAGNTNTTGSNNTAIGRNSDVSTGDLTFATAIGAGTVVSTSNTIQLGRADRTDTVYVSGKLRLGVLGLVGSATVCRSNPSLELSNCSSSIRYKSNVNSFSSGINLIRRLRPVSFDWKTDGMSDLGLIAEEVAEIEPLLVTKNENGEIEGVKYDRVGVVLVNAVLEQQTNIEAQQKEINEQKEIIRRQQTKLDDQEERLTKQQTELDALKALVCSQNPAAEICQPKNRL